MRFFYLDPGLHDDVGHHANYCRYIIGELRGRGIETLVFAHQGLPPWLQTELGAVAHFRAYTYTNNDDDPFCSWLTGFDAFTRLTYEDLLRLPAMAPADIIFTPSARPVQLSAFIGWRHALPSDRRPTIIIDSADPGLAVRRGSNQYHVTVPDPRSDPRATLFRYVARRLPREEGARFHFATFTPFLSELFGLLLQYPIRTLPLPFRAIAPLRNRAGARSIVVAILGHQRPEKGYDQLAEIIQELLRAHEGIRLLVQNVASSDAAEIQRSLRRAMMNGERVVLEETPAGAKRWAQLLEMSDIVLCPYRPEFYISGVSAVMVEALANGIPVIVPAGTALETLLEECGGPGTVFERFDSMSIAAATGRALGQFDHFATLAYQTALDWHKTRGPARLVDELISLDR
jgi:glycosyltransferase involved in cell wall biosynthesis